MVRPLPRHRRKTTRPWSAFFAFLPYVGEAIAILLGLMRSNVWITTVAMFAGKALRYVAVLYAVQGAISLL